MKSQFFGCSDPDKDNPIAAIPPGETQREPSTGETGDFSGKLEAELVAFEAMRQDLLARGFQDKFVAIHGGTVVDSDDDDFRLAARIERQAMRVGPIAICRVREVPSADADFGDYPWAAGELPLEWESQP